MWDITWAIIVLLLLSLAAFHAGERASTSRRGSSLSLAIAVILMFVFVVTLHGQIYLVELLPFSNVIILGNAVPLFAAFLAGAVKHDVRLPEWRRKLSMLALLFVGWLTVAWNGVPNDFPLKSRFKNGVCLQSTPVTCSPCAAVTALDRLGIMSTEREMARLCLTGGRGTNMLGLYRGLKIKTQGCGIDVERIEADFDAMQASFSPRHPVIIAVRQTVVAGDSVAQDSYLVSILSILFGRADHCVVLLEITSDGRAVIGDPSNALQNPVSEPLVELRGRWSGMGFRLIQDR